MVDIEDLIEAVRSDKIVGRGSCSCIDDYYTDDELSMLLLAEGPWRRRGFGPVRSKKGAVKRALETHNQHEERIAAARLEAC